MEIGYCTGIDNRGSRIKQPRRLGYCWRRHSTSFKRRSTAFEVFRNYGIEKGYCIGEVFLFQAITCGKPELGFCCYLSSFFTVDEDKVICAPIGTSEADVTGGEIVADGGGAN